MNRLDIKLKDHKDPSDVTLVVKDGREFQAHRSVLSQASSFFEKLLNSDMKENNEGVIRLEMILESQMADILEFIYTGSVQIFTQENAENLFQLADYLLLPNLKTFAGKCLEEHITTANCLSIYYLAEKYSCQDLIATCRKFIHSNFSSVAKSDDFLNLSSQEVEKWISSDEIAIDAEENVFEVVLRWIDHDKSQRRVKFRDLFRHVRLTCISRGYMAGFVANNDLVKEDGECLESVSLAKIWLDRSTDCYIPRPHPPRRALESDAIVVTECDPIAVNSSFNTHFYFPSTEEWHRLPPNVCKPTHVFSYRGKVFVVSKHFARSQCYDPECNHWSPAPWRKLDSKLAIMKLQRTNFEIHDVLVIEDEICFIVAESFESSPTLWKYNMDMNLMTPLSRFHWIEKRSFCAVVVGKSIYAIGGRKLRGIRHKKDLLALSSAFDTEGNKWKDIAPLKEARRDACGVSKNDEKIFIAGGHGVFDWTLSSCEVYNIATNEWQLIASLTVPRALAKMVLIDGTIYLFEGCVKRPFKDRCNSPDAKLTVECYNEEADIWNDRTAMLIDKISTWGNVTSLWIGEFVLDICSLRLFNFKGVRYNSLYPGRIR